MSTPRLLAAAIAAIPTSLVETAKRQAARRAIDDFVPINPPGSASTSVPLRLGVGSGSTIVYAIQRLAERVQDPNEGLRVICVPTSFQSKNLLADAGVPLSDLNATPELDVAIDGADEVIPGSLDCIKGGGACQTQEKLVANAAKIFVLIMDNKKIAPPQGLLGGWRKGIPLEVLSLAYVPVMIKLKELGGSPVLRMAGASKAGPCVTDNGNFVVDVDFGSGAGLDSAGLGNAEAVHAKLKLIPGVVETGLFPSMASRAYIGFEDGEVKVWDRTS
jgi:ribose 5-phosphate isomerase A